MEDVKESLINAGLSPIEASVYLAVLSNGPVSAGKISKLTDKYRANVYQAIERLKTKGFISEVQGKDAKMFEALSPNNILLGMKKKEKMLEDVMPFLLKMKAAAASTAQIKIIEGANGWRHLLNDFLDTGKERVVYGIPKNAIELMGDFFTEYHKRRAKRKIRLRRLFNFDAKERIKARLPYTESRYLPEELNQPVSTSVCGQIVALTVYQGRSVLTLVIENNIIADTYRKYFEFLWKKAKA